MLNLPPSYRDSVEEERPLNSKKVYSRRPWYAPAVDPGEILREQEHYIQAGGDGDYQVIGGDEYYEYRPHTEYEPPVTSRYGAGAAGGASRPDAADNIQATVSSEYSVAGTVNLREALLVAAGGAGAALVLVVVLAAVCVARRRKNSPAPAPSPPILVYPPHDIAGPSYMTKEVNFSLPSLRSSSLGELRDVISVSSKGSEVLSPPIPTQHRSHSFTNTADLGVLDPSLYKPDCPDEDYLWPEGHVGRVWFTLQYEAATERLQLHVLKAKHLPSRTPALTNACEPLVRIQLLPDERRVLQTKQKKKTCNPFFDETFVYQIPAGKLDATTLKLSVLDAGRAGGAAGGAARQLLGHIMLPLSELEGAAADEEPQLYKMDIEKEVQEPMSDLGEVLVSLLYNENLSRLTVTVVETRAIKLDAPVGRREVVVRVAQARACRGVRARRTRAVPLAADGSALLAECFHFRLRPDELHTTSVTVQALQPHSVVGKDRLVGKFVLGSYMFARGRALRHWNCALASPMEQEQQWHPLSH